MKLLLAFILIFLFVLGYGQEKGLILSSDKKKETISFSFIKNQIVIPIKLNGYQLNFLVDSGLKETLLLSEYDASINQKTIRKVNLFGLGQNNEGTTGFYSTNNSVQIGKNYQSNDINIVIIQDQNFDLFSLFGIQIHGIIGYEFFKNHPIQIDYINRKITIYQKPPKLKKYQSQPIEINQEYKPFIHLDIFHQQSYRNLKVLIDIGNSDGLWLLKEKFDQLQPLQNAFLDELGKGLNGNVVGEKGTIEQVTFGKHEFNNPLISIPDSTSTKFLFTGNNRKGSIGNELLRRFTIVIDYPNKMFYYKANKNLNDPFHYNRSGLTIVHSQFEWDKLEIPVFFKVIDESDNKKSIEQSVRYQIIQKPIYIIQNIRKNSNAEKIGLKPNDIIISLNQRKVEKMSLDDIEEFLKEHEFGEISIEVERSNKIHSFKFILDIPYNY